MSFKIEGDKRPVGASVFEEARADSRAQDLTRLSQGTIRAAGLPSSQIRETEGLQSWKNSLRKYTPISTATSPPAEVFQKDIEELVDLYRTFVTEEKERNNAIRARVLPQAQPISQTQQVAQDVVESGGSDEEEDFESLITLPQAQPISQTQQVAQDVVESGRSDEEEDFESLITLPQAQPTSQTQQAAQKADDEDYENAFELLENKELEIRGVVEHKSNDTIYSLGSLDSTGSNQLKKQIADKQKEILEKFRRSCGFQNLTLSPPLELTEALPAIAKNEEVEQQVSFAKTVWTKKLANIQKYMAQVKAVLEKSKRKILHDFRIPYRNLEQVQFQLMNLGVETHSRGKTPLLIQFFEKERELGKVVYKPRSAETERAILDLFSKLNRLPRSQRSDDTKLPEYKIEPLGAEGSVWEYIKGEKPKGAFASDTKDNTQLKKLEAVCRKIGLTDLHNQNVILRGEEWVPVDMEVIKERSPTGLYPQDKAKVIVLPPLSLFERKLIKDFNQQQKQRSSRFLILNTVDFQDSRSIYKGYDTVLNIIKEKERTNKFDEEGLKKYIAMDFKNGDVPYLIQIDKTIYYCIGRNQVIGELS